MCGICGLVLDRPSRRQLAAAGAAFTRLLVANEARGRHAAGVATVARDGGVVLAKQPLPASAFVETDLYRDVVREALTPRTTVILGHARYATHGAAADPRNNHPILEDDAVGIHNGVLEDPDGTAEVLGLPRGRAVDSEVLVRLFARRSHRAFLADLRRHVRGSIAAALVRLAAPGRIVLLRGNNPLAVARVPAWRAIVFSSLVGPLRDALAAARVEPAELEALEPGTVLEVEVEARGLRVRRGTFTQANEPEPKPRLAAPSISRPRVSVASATLRSAMIAYGD